jgi:hypothetical protein
MKIQIRTKNDLVKLLSEGVSAAWRVNKGRLYSITEVEIYNFSGNARIVGTFDRDNTKVLDNGRVAVAFTDAKIEPCEFKWVGQNPIKYKSGNDEEVELMEDEVEVDDSEEEWNMDYVNDRRIFITGCEGISGLHVGLKTGAFKPVHNFEDIISYLNDIFMDDNADYLFSYGKEGGRIVLEATTYLLGFGDAFEKYMEDYSEEELTQLLNELGLHTELQDFINSCWSEGTTPNVGELVQKILIAPNQTVEVEVIDAEYGNSNYEICT